MAPGVPAALTLRMERAASHPPTARRWPALAPHSAGLSSQAVGPGANADNSLRSLHPSLGSLWLHQSTLHPATGRSGSTFPPPWGGASFPCLRSGSSWHPCCRVPWFLLPALVMPWGCLSSSDRTCCTFLGPTTAVLALHISQDSPSWMPSLQRKSNSVIH